MRDDEKSGGYQAYLEHKSRLDFVKEEKERVFSRNTLMVAGGAFALSTTVLKGLYDHPMPWTRWVLVLSWVVFGLAVFLDIFSTHQSGLAVEEEQKKLKAIFIDENADAVHWPNPHDALARRINANVRWLLLCGFVCMVIFAGANFVKREIPVPLLTPVPHPVVAPHPAPAPEQAARPATEKDKAEKPVQKKALAPASKKRK